MNEFLTTHAFYDILQKHFTNLAEKDVTEIALSTPSNGLVTLKVTQIVRGDAVTALFEEIAKHYALVEIHPPFEKEEK